ncbi:PREDICTED: uncharacterized protein DDB_G0271670 [Bactrocera latifrons]|uniref:uncharacterized protein DDB_G0271670 n=1 Tax=Bactrocera latifrons TaxID=174628 RepID=UPI0008DD1FF1|nr:PREDICTED: uncharacterized protein DDB_G0271670 [Bactrocera latifrons]
MDNLTPQKFNKPTTSSSSSTSNSSVFVAKNTTASPVHVGHKSVSYSSTSSSSDSKMSKTKLTRDQKTTRGFLNCIGKHLGCHFLQQNPRHLPQQQLQRYIYNSQDDLPSSSTDSFSLSYERGSHTGFHLTGSSIDLTCGDLNDYATQPKTQKHHQQHASHNTLSSSAYSGSSCSPAFCSFDVDCLVDIYNADGDADGEEEVSVSLNMYHKQQQQQQQHNNHTNNNVAHSCSSGHNTDTNSSDDDDECSTHEECCEQKQKRKCLKHEAPAHQQRHEQQQKEHPATHKRLHLSRLSIASSVTRMLNHFTSSTSMRSLSCSSTPLRCFKDAKPKEADDAAGHLNARNAKHEHKKHSLPNTSSSSASSSGSRSSSSGSSSSGGGGGKSSNSASGKKKDKKQQSILRPPVHYVYMKGMSGLYSRVPRYTVCSPYAMH